MKGLSNEFRRKCKNIKNAYGDGNASQRIVEIIEKLEINKELLIKRLNYRV